LLLLLYTGKKIRWVITSMRKVEFGKRKVPVVAFVSEGIS